MTKPWTEDECGIGPFYRVRVTLPGSGLIHLASRTEPVVHMQDGKVAVVELELIEGTEHGDTLGFIDWSPSGADLAQGRSDTAAARTDARPPTR